VLDSTDTDLAKMVAAKSSAGSRVAVVGLGIAGLATVKNLSEAGFEVTGFDQSSYIGGLWHYTTDARTSAMRNTTANVPKLTFCFTDFPYPDDAPVYPTAASAQQYLEDYAKHFGLWPHFRLNSTVTAIDRAADQWHLRIATKNGETSGEETKTFDRIVLCLGGHSKVLEPAPLEGIAKYKGIVLNSWTAKR
jgi:dimethylaniline monooxygenase (N-oxide forming)